ncbi:MULTISPECIES: hypothetical protein [unclassified Chryseobacterium]|uniref:hypothetical protein n=1 Tax=unclassified Chryseobacterium TaxID=2593645 RepID=UPI000F4F8FC5|nr:MULTISPECIES: hypothetical protein [unclassified Chryseobacterium]
MATNSLIFASPSVQDGFVYHGDQGLKLTFAVLTNNQVKGSITGSFKRFYPETTGNAIVYFDFKK